MTTMQPTAPNALAVAERDALADLMLTVGPDAPTLCGDWTTRDLAAHLVIRSDRPDAAAGIVIPALAGWTQRVQDKAAQRDWEDLVRTVRRGAPGWSLQSRPSLDGQSNTIEYFVHHEDVRRSQEGWTPRDLDEEANAALWARIAQAGKFFLRKSPVGVVAAPTDGPAAGNEVEFKGGERSVTLRGPVGEIVLAIYGRVTSGLDIEGDPADAEAFRAFGR